MQNNPQDDLCARIARFLTCNEKHINVLYNNPMVGTVPNVTITHSRGFGWNNHAPDCVNIWAIGYGTRILLSQIPPQKWHVDAAGCAKCKFCDKMRQEIAPWTTACRLMPAALSPEWHRAASRQHSIAGGRRKCGVRYCMVCNASTAGGRILCGNTACLHLARWFVCVVYFTKCADLCADVLGKIAHLSSELLIAKMHEK